MREAVLEKLSKESQKIVQLRTVEEYDSNSETAKKKEKDAPRKIAKKFKL